MWFLRKMAWPISLIYGTLVYFRNLLYDYHVLSSKSFDVPTICVGNLSVGGTGKTPMVEYLISRLQDKHRLAVLSRGYKRKSKGFQLGDENATVEQLGDEPFQIHKNFPRVKVAVDADRRNGIARLLEEVKPSLILLDDAFQHRKVNPLFSILLTTYSNPYFEDWYLPTGSLRDSKHAFERADVVVVTKCPSHLEKGTRETYGRRLTKDKGQAVLFSTLVYDDRLYGQKTNIKLEDLGIEQFTLVTGIADPNPLVNYLKEKKLRFEHLKFADHHSFTPTEIDLLRSKELILTTEKDYVRLKGKTDHLYYVKVAHKFLEDDEDRLMQALNGQIKPYC